ncbi:FAD dependent oxidoreductase [Guyanagaster necrorhizus]|uniref:FAD dependent oxidoreductase n=1 Tax=Guyanagaster necrorhizus TaxID=856835 RepID=A0A9P8AWN2_9AGAR|nr:FAD dependent oxidoreductase [Guyanagaster necrorhizus MCA 3950]KAG7450844.1 FAD dependent oxidoreductase [Guyanagaster necrorhizus MCA 3950]
MVSLFSLIRVTIETIRGIVSSYRRVSKRISQSPGLPVSNPTIPFWSIPASPIQKEGSIAALPESADVVIIGSGITGTAFARTLLNGDRSLEVVMLEARDACSGATARNGGHITPPLYHDYLDLKKKHGAEAAKQIIEFRLSHLDELIRVAEEEGLTKESQCRKVETYDVFFDKEVFEGAKEKLGRYLEELSSEKGGWDTVEGSAGMQLADGVCGVISTTGGAIHPYRFVTGILSRLLKAYPSFRLYTHTPCLSIDANIVHTPRGDIRTEHIVHATNGWSSHLLAPMREKIVPLRGHMTAQRAGTGLDGGWLGTRSFVLYPGASEDRWDYLTQQPPDPRARLDEKPQAEFMFGGGVEMGSPSFFDAVGCADDSQVEFRVSAYLGGALAAYFGKWWGGESADVDDDDHFEKGRVKKVWSGILGISADGLPWVGGLPSKVSGRGEGGAEWIAAGYSGEGMVHAWMSGKALAYIILGKDPHWLPAPFLVTEKRWKKADISSWL